METITATDTPFSHRDRAEAAAQTREAMRRGADVIYQGRLEDDDGRWSGYPDFLLRVDRQSALGGWSYEVLDAKLARSAKGAALLQLLLYSDLLTRVQETEPEWMHLALGGGDGRVEASFRVVEYAAYYRAVRLRFEAHAGTPPETYPEPVEHCTICDWKQSCATQRRADDHLSLVAGITRGQRRRLVARDVATMADLAALGLPAVPRIDGVGDGALARIREQARVQDQARRERRRIRELITPVEADKGLAALPEPSDGDVFFDLEGDAFATDDGLEYLFGVADRDGGYGAQWALDQETEKRVFERFIDSVMARWKRHPGFHIYHYGAYETSAVKRLMSRYATREEEVDRLLCGDVFVDLHRVVRQGLRASVERYSIKKLEPFYGFTRGVELTAATRALIRFEATLESGNAGGAADSLRAQIEGYNRDDCLSTLRLAEWLEACRHELQARAGEAVPRPVLRDDARDQERESAAEIAALFETFTAGLPVDDADLDDEQRARRLLAHLLEFHRREEKSMWWEFFERCGFTEEEHVENRATLGALTFAGEVAQVKRSVIHRYRFPEQPHEIEVGDSPKNPATAESDEFKKGFCGTVVALDEAAGTIDLKRGRSSPVPHPAALVPLDAVNSKVLQESLLRLARDVASRDFAPDSPRLAAFDLLRRVPPRVETEAPPGPAPRPNPSSLVAQEETPLDAVRRIAPGLDGAVLPVQGPPGSGKTHTGARMILDLLARGQRVGVTANSHKAIQGIHPPGADVSALGHLLGESATVDSSRGVFLDHTWRMHPDVCAFTTEQFYEGRLGTRPELARQTVLGPGPLAGHGLRFVAAEHAGNTNASEEEAERVAALMRELLDTGAAWVDKEGVHHPLALEDVLVVAPYNAHVATLRAKLPDGARIGTVDKFQGQEAPIVIYSMATSTADEAPRGMEFLYSLHRLNVATSRARCVAAIVASPALLTPDCRTPERMRLANPFCRCLELESTTAPAA